jgi:hypothetical protein
MIEEFSTWSEELKGGFIFAVSGVAVILIIVLSLLLNALDYHYTQRVCLEKHTPRQCRVMDMSSSEIDSLED